MLELRRVVGPGKPQLLRGRFFEVGVQGAEEEWRTQNVDRLFDPVLTRFDKSFTHVEFSFRPFETMVYK